MKCRLSYILLFFCSILGYGQVLVLSETDTRDYQVREPFNLSIGLEIIGENYHQQSPLRLPDLSKFEILGNANESIQTIDQETGNIVRQVVHHFILLPKQAGKIRIGSAQVQVNGRIYKSDPFDINVRDSRKALDSFGKNVSMTMEATNKEVYQNQPVNVILKLKTESYNYEDFRKVNQIKLPNNGKNIHPIDLKRKDIEVGKNNDTATQIVASFIVFPDKDGVVVLSPAMAQFNDTKISSNPLKINVKKLPNDAPITFKNAVGKFEIDVKIPSDEVEVNKPFDVFVRLKGNGNLKQLELPKIKKSDDYSVLKPKQKTNVILNEEGFSGEVVEHYIVIPKKEGNINIDLEEFSYFDIDKNDYQSFEKQEFKVVSLSEEDFDSKESGLDQMMDGTGHILKKVNLLPISDDKKEKENKNNILWWLLVAGVLAGLGTFIFIKRKKQTMVNPISLPEKDKITNVSDTEELIKNQLFISKDYYFRSMKNYLEKEEHHHFFLTYEELHNDAESQVKLNEYKDIMAFLLDNVGEDFANDYQIFRERINIEKYAPVHQDLYEFYNEIVKFYSRIMK